MALSKKHQDAAAAAELEQKRAAQKVKLCKIKSSLTPDQIRVYRQHFELFDLNGDGVINARELRKVSRQMGYRLDDSQIEVATSVRSGVTIVSEEIKNITGVVFSSFTHFCGTLH